MQKIGLQCFKLQKIIWESPEQDFVILWSIFTEELQSGFQNLDKYCKGDWGKIVDFSESVSCIKWLKYWF